MPFEEYEKTNWDKYDGTNGRKLDATNGHKRIFVLWLDEEALAHRKPIASLAGLLCGLKLFDHKNEKFVFVGPQDSNTLRDMVAEINSKPLRECPPEMLVSPGNKLSAPTPASSQAPLDKSNNEQLRTPLANDDLLTVYNFGATAEDKIILKNAGFDPQTDLHDLFLGAGVSYYRTISSDEALADVLARELQRRGIDLCPEWEPLDPRASEDSRCRHLHHDRVFLLSEWDTAYGRYLPETVSDVFGADDSSFGDCRLNTRHGIMHASYLRGLDGRFPSRRPSKDEKPAADDATATRTMSDDTNGGQPTAATPETAQRYETAEGQSQYDYLRRITRLLKECDDKLRLQAKGKVAAIGVLGSDVYDKLLLLQALRPEFPEALFFTTDLDELLLPQGKLRYTRNLLVASGFGLTLAPDLQRDVLPFRSTYQTAVFLATRLAIRNGDLIKPPTEQENEPKTVKANDPKIEPRWADTAVAVRCWSKQPLLFQIGRTVPRGLPIDPIAGKFDACKDLGKDPKADFVNYSTIQPEVPRLYQNFSGSARWGVFLLVIPLLVTLLSLRPIRKVFKPEDALSGVEPADRVVPSSIWLTPLAVVALIVWALVTLRWPMTACWLTEYPNGEPITLFEGISVWPTIASRVFGTILSLFLIWYTLRVLAINLQETKDKMAIPPSEEVAAPSKLFSRLWFPPQSSYTILDYDDTGRPKVAFRDIVNESSLKPGVRCLRAAVGTLVMILLSIWILAPVFGDVGVVPARGVRAHTLYLLTVTIDVLTTLFLTFLVADATAHSCTFISRLTKISTKWPPETIAKFKQQFGLEGDGLADWLDMKYIAIRTGFITQLIYLPFLALTVLFLSRNHLFDDFSMPWTLAALQALSIAVVIGPVLAYRSAAENARKAAREHLTAKIIAAQGVRKTAAQLERMLNEIESLREGAFAPLTSQPIVKAVLLPLVTYGGAWLAHIYGLPGT